MTDRDATAACQLKSESRWENKPLKQELQRRIKEFDRRRGAQLNVKVIICFVTD